MISLGTILILTLYNCAIIGSSLTRLAPESHAVRTNFTLQFLIFIIFEPDTLQPCHTNWMHPYLSVLFLLLICIGYRFENSFDLGTEDAFYLGAELVRIVNQYFTPRTIPIIIRYTIKQLATIAFLMHSCQA